MNTFDNILDSILFFHTSLCRYFSLLTGQAFFYLFTQVLE